MIDAVADALDILTGDDFGQSISVTSPGGVTAALTGFGLEIGQTLEPESGQLVAGTRASIAIPLGPLRAAFGDSLPVNVPSRTSLPWVVTVFDAAGVQRAYKVIDTMPDLRLGVVVCVLGTYKP